MSRATLASRFLLAACLLLASACAELQQALNKPAPVTPQITEATLREFAHRSGAMEVPELREARELARLALVAHLGTRNALRLHQAGIRRVRDLAAADLQTLEARLARSGPVPPAPVLRLWKRAARRELQ